mgnify:CR=1 FL=1
MGGTAGGPPGGYAVVAMPKDYFADDPHSRHERMLAGDLRLVLTGDIAAGPQPAEVLDLLPTLGERVVWIGGNAGRELLEYRSGQRADIPAPSPPGPQTGCVPNTWNTSAGCRAVLSPPVRGMGEVLFCHATPRDDEEVVLVDSRLDRWEEGVRRARPGVADGGVRAYAHAVRAAGHGCLVVDPGSVGTPYGRSGAHRALLGPGVELRTTGFDIEQAIARITRESGYPEAAEWADSFLHARASDAGALETFGPRDGRAPAR